MKHLFTLKVFLIACFSMLIGGAVAQTKESFDFSAQGYTNQTAMTSVNSENFTITFDKGSNSNAPKYYTSGTAVRVYGGGTMTVASKELTITNISITFGSSDGSNALTADVGSLTKGEWAGESNTVVFSVGGTSGNRRIKAVTVTFAPEAGAVLAPAITPETGTMFDESLTVTITPEDASHTVWYTTDGTEPTNAAPSIQYIDPFTISATTTVKAIATDGTKVSDVVTAEYTKVEAIEGLAALVAKIKEDNSTSDREYNYNVKLTDAVVTGVSGSNVYVEEGETGILLYKSGHGLTVGQKYSGVSPVTARLYKGLPELTSFDFTLAEENVTLPLTTVSLADLYADYDKYLSRRIKIENATVTSAFVSKSGQITQSGTDAVVYAKGGDDIVMAVNDVINLVVFPNKEKDDVNDVKELNVLAQEDITVVIAAPVFYFSTDAVSVREDKTVDEPVLTNTYADQDVTFTSDDTSVATVDAKTGEVTIVGAGITTITASLTDGPSASYTLTVTALVNGYYYLVTSDDELVAGGRYLIVSKNETKNQPMAMAAQSGTYRAKVEATIIEEDGLSVIKGLPTGAHEVVLGEGSIANTWSLYDDAVESKGYLYYKGSDNSVSTSESVTGNKELVYISFDSEGNAIVNFYAYPTRNLRYNTGSPRFACYTTAQTAIQLYKLYTEFSIGADGFATFYTDKAFVMPEGVEGGIVTATNGDKLAIEYNYASGATVPAGTALLLKGAAGKYAYELSTSKETAPTNNMLHGADAVDADKNMFVEGTGVKYYILSKDKDGNNLGFYWAADNGAPIAYQAGKSFLAVDFGAGVKVFSMFSLDDTTTGINGVESAKTANGKIYTLTGVCVGNDLKALPKGVYIINGKKIAQ